MENKREIEFTGSLEQTEHAQKIFPAHMALSQEMVGLSNLEHTVSQVVGAIPHGISDNVLQSEEFDQAMKDLIPERALTITQKMKAKHFDRLEQKKVNQEIQDRFDAAGVIHNEQRIMAIPGAIPPQALIHLNPTYPVYIEGLLQDKLWKIQGVRFKQ